MANFSRTKTWDPGTLGANLATFDSKVDRAITRLCDEEAIYAQDKMKLRAPWTQTGMRNRWGRVSTGAARSSLWARSTSHPHRYGISMGHGVKYGKYLELAMEERFQIVIPTMLETATSLMRSLENLFAELRESEAVVPVMAPGIAGGTTHEVGSEITSVTHHYVNKTKRTAYRDAKGRFVSKAKSLGQTVAQGVTKRTRRTRRG